MNKLTILTILLLSCVVVSAQDFTIVQIPDIQYFTANYNNSQIYYENQINWVINNSEKLNIQMVLFMGDLVENWDNQTQWAYFNTSVSKLEQNNISYLLNIGNHDFYKGNYSNFDYYFGEDRRNYYILKNISNKTYGFITIEFNASFGVFEWAREILSNNSNISFMFVNHFIQYQQWYAEPTESFKLVNSTQNIIMSFCGHSNGDDDYSFERSDGSFFYGFLTNFQDEMLPKFKYYYFNENTSIVDSYLIDLTLDNIIFRNVSFSLTNLTWMKNNYNKTKEESEPPAPPHYGGGGGGSNSKKKVAVNTPNITNNTQQNSLDNVNNSMVSVEQEELGITSSPPENANWFVKILNWVRGLFNK